jgi:hypothetical protein
VSVCVCVCVCVCLFVCGTWQHKQRCTRATTTPVACDTPITEFVEESNGQLARLRGRPVEDKSREGSVRQIAGVGALVVEFKTGVR